MRDKTRSSASRLSPTARLLVAARAARSVGQGALVADFSLYLHRLGWTAAAISMVLSLALLAGGMMSLAVGPLSDRIGRRHFLLGYEWVQLAAALVACASADMWILGAAGIAGGFGRGGNGSAGPFAPAEQAWLAQSTGKRERAHVFSFNAACGSIGMAFGAALAATPAWLTPFLPGALAFRPLFALAALCSCVCLALLYRAHDAEARSLRAAAPSLPAEEDTALRKKENKLILRLVAANILNGSGIGLTGPLISYWFAIRFGQGPALIGPLMAAGFLLSGFASLGAGRLAERFGIVRSVIGLRLLGLAMLVGIPLAPSFGSAAALYALRNICNRSSMGPRNALNVAIVRQSRRGFSAGAANVSLEIPRAIGPMFAGLMFQAGFLELPFFIGAAFQAGYVYIYGKSFGGGEFG